ncbi:MAG TPA: DUF4136 domain-containing protein [Chryseolinea sp.]|nr:DUF4136 domain-containing protein [Chryseolinea sp.]
MRLQKVFVIISVVMVLWSCQTEPDNLKLYDELVVSTNFDPDVTFSSYVTYAIPTDTIGFVSDSNPNDTILVAASNNSFYPRKVLERIMQNMDDRVYTRVSRDEDPDLGVNVYVVEDLNVFQQIIDPGYYYPYYYGYGSYYSYPYINTYAYNTGTLIVEIVDLKNVTPDNKVRVIWNAYMGDVYSALNIEEQSLEAIDQAFVQSNYLVNEK